MMRKPRPAGLCFRRFFSKLSNRKLAEDFEFDADATVIDDEVFEKLINSEFTTVSSKDDIYNDGNGMFTASVKVPETDPEEIGNYVVFVRVQDNVGNAMIYGSMV